MTGSLVQPNTNLGTSNISNPNVNYTVPNLYP